MRRQGLLLVVLAGCGLTPVGQGLDGGGPAPDASTPAVVDSGVPFDPATLAPQRWPPPTGPLATHDVDASLAAVLETAALQGACEAVKAGAADSATRLKCGKWMFFYETYGTVGVPVALLKFAQKYFADFYGQGFATLGFIADPANAEGMPLGLAPTTGKLGSVETRAFTCAACHFGRLPDGRYAVGFGNTQLDYGTFLASLGAPLSLSFNENDPKVAPALRARFKPLVAANKAKAGYTAEAGLVGLSLLGAGSTGSTTVEEQERYLSLVPGTMDFLTPPLLDDGVWTVSRILSLWNLPDAAQRAKVGMAHEMLSWNGGVPGTLDFLKGFVAIGVGAAGFDDARLRPLEEYLRTLRAPAPLQPPSAQAVRAGAALFVERGCLGCHGGPSGEGARVFTFAELETDGVYGTIYNPAADGTPCCGLGVASGVTRGVKAPRMAGLFSAQRLLHNGSVRGLKELFCLEPRNAMTGPAQGAGGHWMTCVGLEDFEKRALIDYLEAL